MDSEVGSQIVTGVFTLAGAILGAALGLFGERYIRERGEVRCEISADWVEVARGQFGAQEFSAFEVSFYNDKDVALALWDIRMDVIPEEGEPERVGLQSASGEWVSFLNLPPHTGISERLQMTVGGALLYRIKHAKSLRFAGTFPRGKKLSKELPSWDLNPQ